MPGSIVAAAFFQAGTVAFAAATFAVNFAVSYVITRVFGSKPPNSQDTGARQQVPPANNNSIPVVYGDAWLGGVFVDAVLSSDQKTMYYVLAISSISSDASATFSYDRTKFYYGDRLVTFDGTDQTKVVSLTDGDGNVDTKISGNLYISLYTSTNAGTITAVNGTAPNVTMGGSDIPVALRWPSSGRQMNGLAFAIVKLNYNADAGTTGLQPITFYCKHYPKGGTVAKPGDVWYDYMTDARYGAGMTGLVDSTSATALNTYSDQTITYTPAGGGSATQARYRINGVVDTGRPVLENVEKMLECSDSWMAYNAASGLWSIVINKAESSTFSFNDTNLIGEIRVSATDINQQINQIQIEFPSKLNRDQPDLVYMETPAGLLYPNEPPNRQTTTLEFTNDSVQAQYLGNRRLEQAREDLIVTITSTYPGIQVDAGDVVDITNADYGWTNKLFRVMKVSEATVDDGNLGASLELSEYNAVVYDDASITAFTAAPNSSLPSPNYFSSLNAPVIGDLAPSAAPPTFSATCTMPAVGRVTTITLFYTTSASPSATDWKVWSSAILSNGSTFANSSTFKFDNITLSAASYYFAFSVENDSAKSSLSATSSVLVWSPTAAAGPTGPTGSQGPTGSSVTGPTGSSGLVGIAALTAYLVQSQSSSTPTFTTPTSGSAVPAGWSSTVPAVAIGQVLWYIQGRYNANAVTVDGVPANSTAWTGPIAASIFQSIRSDNYNGPTPPTTSNFGTLGWYLDQPSGNLYANAAYLRGELVTGVSGAQRVEINKGVSNKVAVYNSSNTLLASFGGTGTSTDAILRLNPIIAGTTAYGATTVIPNPSGTNYVAASYYGQTTDASLEGILCGWYTVGATTVRYGTAGTRDYGSGVVSGFLGYQDNSYSAAVRGYNSAGGTEVSIADSAGYAINVRSGSIRYGSYTFSAFNGSTTQFLRGDGTFATPSGGTVTSVSGTGSVSGITLSGTVTTSGSLTLGGTISLSASDIPNLPGSKITSGIVSESYVGGFKNGTGTIVGIAGTGSTSVLNSFIGSDGATASDNFDLFTLSGSTYAGVFINQRGTTSTWSTFTSDARMKDVVGAIPVSNAIDAYKQIGKPVVWKWKFEQSTETWGYTAQQVGSGLPQALIESPILPNGDYQKIPGTDERVLTFDNNKLQILKDLVIAELIAKVEALEARVSALEAK
jgi:hypothetical protein